ncbi:THxN family PEP-CTERM protein [Parapedomonas caeni]
MSKKNWIAAAVVGLATSVASLSANADMITEWSVSVNSGWQDSTWSSAGPGSFDPAAPYVVSGALPNGADFNGGLDYDIVKWGTPRTANGQSFLGVDDQYDVGGLLTNDAAGVAGASVFHGNFVQASSSPANPAEKYLDNTTLIASISFTPTNPAGPSLGPISVDFAIDFWETSNISALETCPGAPWPDATVTCPDRFIVSLENASYSTIVDGYIYTFTLSFDPLASSFLRIDDNGDGTVTIWTAEGQLSKLATIIHVTARVPEPATVGLLGAGLALAGLARRRRK